jgi:hypothetical protein
MSDRRRSAGALVVALVMLGLTGCASATPGGPLPEPVTVCGEYTLDQGESISQEAVDCMAEGGPGATLTVTTPTVEGDPIVTTYTGLAGGGYEVHADMSKDRWGGGTSTMVCPDAVSVVDLRACDTVAPEG